MSSQSVELFSRLRRLLMPFGWLYGGIVALRNWGYDRGWLQIYAAPVPVIAVGNISAGGTGKTPLSQDLLQRLVEQGWRPAYLSRGYGRKTRGFIRVEKDRHLAEEVGDEALQVAHRFPDLAVAVCEDRRKGIRCLLQENPPPNILVLDDAFQHRKVARDLDIVVIDATRPPRQDALLPAGNQREYTRGLARADLIVLSKSPDKETSQRLTVALQKWKKPIMATHYQPKTLHLSDGRELPVDVLHDQPVRLLAGIGNPESFRTLIENLGATVQQTHWLSDHQPLSIKLARRLVDQNFQASGENPNFAGPLLICTEKDHYRMLGTAAGEILKSLPYAWIEVGLRWADEGRMIEALLKKLPEIQPSGPKT